MPPMRKVLPLGASLAATCEGVKKNTRLFSNAISTSAVAMPRAAMPSAMAASRLCLGFKLLPSSQQERHLEGEQRERDDIGCSDVPVHSRSRIRQRTRTMATAML